MTNPSKAAAEGGVPIWGVHGLALLTTALVSTSFPIGAAIAPGLDPAVLMVFRFTLAAALFAPFVAYRHGLRLPRPRDLARYAAIGLSPAIFFFCMFAALRHTSALNTGALSTLQPGVSALFGAALVGERLGWRRLAALLIAMLGALWVIFRGDMNRALALEVNVGDLIFIAGIVAMGANFPMVRRLYRGEPTMVLTLWTLVMADGWLILAANAKLWTTDWGAVDAYVLAGAAYLAVFTTIISFFLSQYCTLRIGPTRVNAHRYLTPAFVILIAWVAGQGMAPLAAVPGALIVVLAIPVILTGAAREDTVLGRAAGDRPASEQRPGPGSETDGAGAQRAR